MAIITRRVSCLFSGNMPPAEVWFNEVSNHKNGWMKPDDGLWTVPDERGTGESAWETWCREEDFEPGMKRHLYRLTVDGARVYTIDTVQDLLNLIRRFPFQGGKKYIDFEAAAREYDAIELTENGQHATRFSEPADLYGWDVPSILWLRWMPFEVEQVR